MGNVSAEFDYKLMDEPTLLKLYGKPVMSFKDPVDEIAKIKDKAKFDPVNPKAVFQKKILHPKYAPVEDKKPSLFSKLNPSLNPSLKANSVSISDLARSSSLARLAASTSS